MSANLNLYTFNSSPHINIFYISIIIRSSCHICGLPRHSRHPLSVYTTPQDKVPQIKSLLFSHNSTLHGYTCIGSVNAGETSKQAWTSSWPGWISDQESGGCPGSLPMMVRGSPSGPMMGSFSSRSAIASQGAFSDPVLPTWGISISSMVSAMIAQRPAINQVTFSLITAFGPLEIRVVSVKIPMTVLFMLTGIFVEQVHGGLHQSGPRHILLQPPGRINKKVVRPYRLKFFKTIRIRRGKETLLLVAVMIAGSFMNTTGS